MYTRSWADLIRISKKLAKGVGSFDDIKAEMCDFVSNEMYTEYPWKDTITTMATTSFPLIDGQQDYDSPINIYRLISARIVRTDTTPEQNFELNIADSIPVDMVKRSHVAIRSCSQEQAVGTLRLESAVTVASGVQLYLGGTYQLNPIKIIDVAQDVWFKDQYAQVGVEGIMYWAYKLSDDPRAGGAQMTGNGDIVYTGQLGTFKSAVKSMRMAEDYGASNALFPEVPMGQGRDTNNFWFLNW